MTNSKTDQESGTKEVVVPAKWHRYVPNVIILCVISFLAVKVFYVPAKEGKFLIAAQEAFATGKEAVKISDLTDFDWDRVCDLIGGKADVSQAELEQYTKADWSESYSSLPGGIYAAGCFLCSRLGLAFIKNGKVVQVLAFDDPAIIENVKVFQIVDPIEIHDKKNADKICWPREHAYLVRHHPGPYSDGLSESLEIGIK